MILRYWRAEDCVSGKGSSPCIAAPLYEWAWVAIVVSVLALGTYTQYKSRKLCHIADRLGVPVGDAFVMLRPDRRANRARTRRARVGMLVAPLLGALATGLCFRSASAALVGLLLFGGLGILAMSVYTDWWLIQLRVDTLGATPGEPEHLPPLCEDDAEPQPDNLDALDK